MKLLFDANVSHKLVTALAAEYPGSSHVRDVGVRWASDSDIWDYAAAHVFAIVSKDTDFRERSYVEGSPPKVIWLDVGNAPTSAIADLLRRDCERLKQFDASEETSVLILSLGETAV